MLQSRDEIKKHSNSERDSFIQPVKAWGSKFKMYLNSIRISVSRTFSLFNFHSCPLRACFCPFIVNVGDLL